MLMESEKTNKKKYKNKNTKPCYNSVVLKILSYYSLCSIVSVPVMLSVLLYFGAEVFSAPCLTQ